MKYTAKLIGVAGALTIATFSLHGSFTPASGQDPLPAEAETLLRKQFDRFSTFPMLLTAEALGITEIQGKSISGESTSTQQSPKRLIDVPIAFHPTKHENEPTVATSPRDKKKLVAGSHFFGLPPPTDNRCLAFTSSDGGATWSAGFPMPQLTLLSRCSDPVLAYAPDGSRVFYAYMDVKLFPFDWDVLVSYSNDDGQTWIGPFVAFDSAPNVFLYDKPWIATPLDDSNLVYVTATRIDLFGVGACHIDFTRSTDAGVSYAAPTTLDTAPGCCDPPASAVVVQASRPSGGKHGDLLVAWYHSGTDGWLIGSFNLRTSYSGDSGATFAPIVVAATDSFETPFWKGPFACYERWWGSMSPDVEIDASGSAHIGYAHDPVANPFPFAGATAENGDIRYITSRDAPYTVWSAPVTVNDDASGTAQGYVAIDTQTQQTGQSATLHAIWMDARLSPPPGAVPECGGDVENLFYDIFYSTKPPGEGWRDNVRVTTQSSISDFIFLGDYIDLTTDNGSLYTVWTDRRDKTSIFDGEDDVWGSRTHQEH